MGKNLVEHLGLRAAFGALRPNPRLSIWGFGPPLALRPNLRAVGIEYTGRRYPSAQMWLMGRKIENLLCLRWPCDFARSHFWRYSTHSSSGNRYRVATLARIRISNEAMPKTTFPESPPTAAASIILPGPKDNLTNQAP